LIKIKNILALVSICVVLILGAFVFDYAYNQKSVSVNVYTVLPKDIQNNFNINGRIEKQGNVNMLIGISNEAPNIPRGAGATITLNEKSYDGYLYEISNINNNLHEVKISIMTKEDISGEATANIVGSLEKNIIVVPYSCIFTDEFGKDAIMVENQGFAVKRNVVLGKLNNENGTEILEGVCPDEKIIISPQNLKTGDKVGIYEFN
jgi:multidrug efflux pump subunit AcrA (membrane-fusion protein)